VTLKKDESEKRVRTTICWKPAYLKLMKNEANKIANGSVSHMVEIIVERYFAKLKQ
jgi:hypothetical protein